MAEKERGKEQREPELRKNKRKRKANMIRSLDNNGSKEVRSWGEGRGACRQGRDLRVSWGADCSADTYDGRGGTQTAATGSKGPRRVRAGLIFDSQTQKEEHATQTTTEHKNTHNTESP